MQIVVSFGKRNVITLLAQLLACGTKMMVVQ
jgi:hypothetical protein